MSNQNPAEAVPPRVPPEDRNARIAESKAEAARKRLSLFMGDKRAEKRQEADHEW